MANAKKLPSGQWRVQIFSHTEMIDGKPKKIRESFTAPTKKEAEYQAALFKLKNERRTEVTITLGDAIEGYINSKDGILSPSTIRGYKQIKKTYLHGLQDQKLSEITNLKIQVALNQEKKASNLSPKTMRNIAGLLSSSIKLFNEDFKFKVTLPEKERYDYHLPSQEEIANLLDFTQGTELHIAILLGACLGLRRGEICALNWNDFDWDKKTVKINKAKVLDESDQWKTKNPKSYSGNRVLSLSEGLINELKKYESKGSIVSISPTIITHRFTRAVKASGIEHFRFHDLRHFNASLMMAQGIPDKYAMERMGHSTTHMLKSVYQHTENQKRNEINNIMNECVDSFLDSGSHKSSHAKK
ncbi:MAG TPA: site-specific integrase [Clostridium sp.]|nr:site-specific integrase [Clostridium sp.]